MFTVVVNACQQFGFLLSKSQLELIASHFVFGLGVTELYLQLSQTNSWLVLLSRTFLGVV